MKKALRFILALATSPVMVPVLILSVIQFWLVHDKPNWYSFNTKRHGFYFKWLVWG